MKPPQSSLKLRNSKSFPLITALACLTAIQADVCNNPGQPGAGGAECFAPDMVFGVRYNADSKPGFAEFYNGAQPTIVRHYVNQVVSYSATNHNAYDITCPYESPSNPCTWTKDPGRRNFLQTESLTINAVSAVNKLTHAQVNSYSGTNPRHSSDEDFRDQTHNVGSCGGQQQWHTYYYKITQNAPTVSLGTVNNQPVWTGNETTSIWTTDSCVVGGPCSDPVNSLNYTFNTWTAATSGRWYPNPDDWNYVSPISRTYSANLVNHDCNGGNSGSFSATGSIVLSDEYTDGDLERRVRSAFTPSMPWLIVPAGSAKRQLSPSHESLYLRQELLRFSFPAVVGQRYVVSWTEYTFGYEGGFSEEQKFWILSSAQSTTVTHDEIVEPPSANGIRFAANFKVCAGWSALASAGTAKRMGGASASACCGGGGELGDGAVSLDGGPALTVSLGKTDLGMSAGILKSAALTPHGSIAHRSSVRPALIGAATEVITDSNGEILQAKSPQRLAHLESVSASQFKVFLFLPNAAPKGGNGLYPTNGLTLLSAWAVTAPDAAQGNFDRVQITEDKGSGAKLHEFVYAAAGRVWTVTRPDGLAKERQSSSWSVADPANADFSTPVYLTQTYELLNPTTPVVVYHEETRYQLFDGVANDGSDQTLWLSQRKVGSGANALVTDYSFEPSKGWLKSSGGAGNGWTSYTYDGGNLGKVTSVISGIKDTPEDYSNQASYLIRKQTLSYASVDLDNDDGVALPLLPRTETEVVENEQQSAAVSQVKRVVHRNVTSGVVEWIREYRLHALDADLLDLENLVTETQFYPTGAYLGLTKSVKTPDGMMQLFAYSDASGSRTSTVESGLPNAGGTSITKGTRTITVVNSAGITTSSMTYNVDGTTSLLTASTTWDNPDSRGRPQRRLDNLSGLADWSAYGCCTLDSTTSRDGTVTSYTYDSLNRLKTSTTAGVKTINNYDWSGRLQSVQRQSTGGASTITLNSYVYDDAGRLTSEMNPAGVTTTYAEDYSNGYLVKTTTEAVATVDVVTRKERYFRDGQLAETGGTAAAPDTGSNPVRYDYGVIIEDPSNPEYRPFRITINLTAPGTTTGTNEWVLTLSDFFGRPYKTVYPVAQDPTPDNLADNPASQSFYDNAGRLVRQVDPDGVTTLFLKQNYNEDYTVVDMDKDGVIDWTGPDRITKTLTEVVSEYGTTTRRVTTSEYKFQGNSSPTVLSTTSSSVDGLRNWAFTTGVANTAQTVTAYPGLGNRTVTSTAPDGSYSVAQYQYGRVTSQTQYTSTGSQVTRLTYTYDTHGRQWKVNDARNGTTTFTYDSADRVAAVTSPAPGTGLAAQTTTTVYDYLGRAKQVTQPDGTVVNNEYFPTGQLKKTYGSRTYPVEYTYDAQGRMKTLKTWQTYPTTGSATTTWNYNAYRGYLDTKRYHDNSGPDFTYTKGGRMKTRKWARTGTGGQKVLTTWTYGFESSSGAEDAPYKNDSGDVVTLAYSNDPQATPAVTYAYDRCGHPTTITRNGMTTTRTFNTTGQLLTESFAGANSTLNGLSVETTYDTNLRRDTVTPKNGAANLATNIYTYDTASRLATVRDHPTAGGSTTYSATYGYLANSLLPGTVTYKLGATTALTTSRSFDFLNRLYLVNSVPAGSAQIPLTYRYGYNDAGQRVTLQMPDGSGWRYQYDALGQLVMGRRYWPDGTAVAGQQFEYGFDDIGNRKGKALLGGDANGANLRESTYTLKANGLNQYETRTVPAYVDILGAAYGTVAPTVNGLTVDARKGEYFWKQLSVPNSTAKWQSVSVNVPGGTAQTGNVLVPPATQSFSYDTDGNLLGDGLWDYTWDAENRLIQMITPTTAYNAGVPGVKLTFEYDDQGRRIAKRRYNSTTSLPAAASYPGSPNATLKFLYDGWNVLAELDGSNQQVRTYLWGNDLSGSPQGAGGVGGLLKVTQYTWGGVPNPALTHHFVAYDGNGNVTGLVDGATGVTTATYEFGPFGELLRANGTLAKANPFRFSTKYTDDETDLLYYGYRFYSPSLGRWINRDPSEEHEDDSLYSFVGNSPSGGIDYLGLYQTDFHFYAVYYILRTLCFPPETAYSISYYSQAVDDNPETDPIKLALKAVKGGDPTAILRLERFHFRESSSSSAVVRMADSSLKETQEAMWQWNRSNGGDAFATGTALHTFADTFSHEGFTAWHSVDFNRRLGKLPPIGHLDTAEGGTAPDLPYLDTKKAMETANAILALKPNRSASGNIQWVDLRDARSDLKRIFEKRGTLKTRMDNAQQIIKERFGDEVKYVSPVTNE